MPRLLAPAVVLLVVRGLVVAGVASSAGGCTDCADHEEWPKINGIFKIAQNKKADYEGSSKSDELLGHHGSDELSGGGGSDVLWGDWDPKNQPPDQYDTIDGGKGTDFIYGSHGYNLIRAGDGNDVISVHYGRGIVNCGAGKDIYHVAKSRQDGYSFKNCEKVDYRPESVRGGGLRPLP